MGFLRKFESNQNRFLHRDGFVTHQWTTPMHPSRPTIPRSIVLTDITTSIRTDRSGFRPISRYIGASGSVGSDWIEPRSRVLSGVAPQLLSLNRSCGGDSGVSGSDWIRPETRILSGFAPQLFSLYRSYGGDGGVSGSYWIGPESRILRVCTPTVHVILELWWQWRCQGQ